MTIDISRKSFKPRKHYAGVMREQGRVDLDADGNDGWAIADRRERAATVDLAGRCRVSQLTPDAFRINIEEGNLTIGQGRMLVDGLLADNPGDPTIEFDPVLSEQAGTPEIPFDQQPFPPATNPVTLTDGVHLVYLDVWRRYVTALEDPELIETAVGVPTTSRVQTVWQVKILPNVGRDVTCATPDEDIPGWVDIIQPSDGRLSTQAAEPPIEEDLCEIPPTGGLSGWERGNNTFLLQIHTVDDNNEAFFKWARDNASFATVINAIPSLDTLLVESTRRDSRLSFENDDWVEINDESRELAGEPGILRRISVDHATGTITLDQNLPAGIFPTLDAQGNLDPSRRTRVRRWHQSSEDGLIPVPAPGSSLILENGVQVTFDLAAPGGRFRAGDYWSFIARYESGFVEELVQAPPHGFHHHYCRLALVETVGGEFVDVIEDCRPADEPDTEVAPGCCTAVVRPGEDIQAAIDALPAVGGCVCLKPGRHEINGTLRIEDSNIELHGETQGVIIHQLNDDVTAVAVDHPAGLLISGISIVNIQFEFDNSEIDGSSLAPLLALDNCEQVTIRNCGFAYQRAETLTGVRIGFGSGIRLEQCEFDMVSMGVWVAADSTALSIVNNRFHITGDDGGDGGLVAVFLENASGASSVEGNDISGYISGIRLNSHLFDADALPSSNAVGSVIADNRITRSTLPVDDSENKVFAIEAAANNCVIRDNEIRYASHIYGGISMFGNYGRIENNVVRLLRQELIEAPAIGILMGMAPDDAVHVVSHGRIHGNRIFGPQNAVVVLQNDTVDVTGNHIEGIDGPVGFAIVLIEVDRARVTGNRITNALLGMATSQGAGNRFTGNELRGGGTGMSALAQTEFEFARNRVEDMRFWGFLGLQFIGKTSITENRMVSCGHGQTPAIGIGVSGVFGDLHIASCEVMNTGVSPDAATISQPAWGMIADLVLECLVHGNIVTYSNSAVLDANTEDRALWLRGYLDHQGAVGAADVDLGFSAQVSGNKFLGPGFSALVEFQEFPISDFANARFQSVTFENNFVWHRSTSLDESRATVVLRCREFIMMGCHIKSTTPFISVDGQNRPGIFMGNITRGGTIRIADFPSPEASFNRQ